MAEIQRRKTGTVKIGQVRVGWEVPVVVQSMTNTDTADIAGTIEQVAALALAGSEIVRITVNNDEAAAASSLLTVTRTISDPASARAATCSIVPATSAVSVLVIDCTTTGTSQPTRTCPILTVGVFLR